MAASLNREKKKFKSLFDVKLIDVRISPEYSRIATQRNERRF